MSRQVPQAFGARRTEGLQQVCECAVSTQTGVLVLNLVLVTRHPVLIPALSMARVQTYHGPMASASQGIQAVVICGKSVQALWEIH